jgi:hypothetical protein
MATTAKHAFADPDREASSTTLVVRTQVAYVRALAHEISRHHAPGTNMSELYEQLQDEIERLDAMFGDAAPPTFRVR